MTAGLQLGAPGIYPAPERVDRSFRPVRLDVAGFAGLAPRGPVDQPVLVQSWTDYQLRFGGLEGAGLLPYAVSAFFEQGGERAYVVRVAPHEGPDPGLAAAAATARHRLPLATTAGEPVLFAAHDEGAWGNRLNLQMDFDAAQQFQAATAAPAADPGGQPPPPGQELLLPDGVLVPAGSLLQVRGPRLPMQGAFRWVDRVVLREVAPGRRQWVAVLDQPLPGDGVWGVAVVTATLRVDDGDPAVRRAERIPGLGLHSDHPQFLARVVEETSLLVAPVGAWAGATGATKVRVLPPDPLLGSVASAPQPGWPGRDRDAEVTGASFFDGRPDDPPDDDPLDERDHHGADRLAREAEVGLLVVPDLLWQWQAEEPVVERSEDEAGATFAPCPPPPLTTTYRPPPPPTTLDARDPEQLEQILTRQLHLVALADRERRFVALLDVPRGLSARNIAHWRARFDSSYAAAYHPWLAVTRTAVSRGAGARAEAVLVPPSAFAAGIIAARERRFGLPWGPANELARGAVRAADLVSDAEHDVLHQLGVNVYRAERDGFRLTAARTLSRDRSYRQLSVRRLMTMLRLALDRQSQWVVFEPNTADLRTLLNHTLVAFLRDLYQGGAFAGESEEETFFVRSDDSLNPRASLELGRLVVEVGVAPAEPLEFLVLRISREGDGGVRVEEVDRA